MNVTIEVLTEDILLSCLFNVHLYNMAVIN